MAVKNSENEYSTDNLEPHSSKYAVLFKKVTTMKSSQKETKFFRIAISGSVRSLANPLAVSHVKWHYVCRGV